MRYIALIILMTLSLSSCSTVAMFLGKPDGKQCDFPPYIYGGVLTDGYVLVKSFEHDDDVSLGHRVLVIAYAITDAPFSAVADTVILPYTVYRQIEECQSN